MDSGIADFTDVMSDAMDALSRTFYTQTPLDKTWKRVLYSIGDEGVRLFEHSHVALSKNNSAMLEVVTDHGGWKQLLQLRTPYILKGFSMYAKQLHIDCMRVTVKNENSVWCQ